MTKPKNTLKKPNAPSLLVGMGASAGGLSALQDFFEQIPADTGMCFVIIQHLSSEHKSMMSEILQKSTPLTIRIVKRAVKPKPNHIYLMPNHKNLVVKEGKIATIDKPTDKSINMPVDLFFDSMSQLNQRNTVGMILSGTGTDGARGIKTLKECGGLIFCQSPESSQFDGMPNASLDLGLVDFKGTPQELAQKLLSVNASYKAVPAESHSLKSADRDNHYFQKILEEVSQYTNIDFKQAYRKTTLKRRVEKRLHITQTKSFKNYYNLILDTPEEINRLKQEFYIGVTHFFRDLPAWRLLEDFLADYVKTTTKSNYKVWVAGCSTGEEAYSVAMVFDALQKLHTEKPFRYKIFATDLDRVALQRASAGVFYQSARIEVPSEYLNTCFRNGPNDTYHIQSRIREKIVFSQHDLLSDPPFLHVDLLICRNLLIYFEPEYQQKIVRNLEFSLDPGSLLFLGPSESLGAKKNKAFVDLDKKWNVFQYRPNTPRKGRLPHIAPRTIDSPKSLFNSRTPISVEQHTNTGPPPPFEEIIQQAFEHAILFVNQEGRILYSKGPIEDYIRFPRSEMTLHECLPQRAALLLQSAVRKVLKEKKDMAFTPLRYLKGTRQLEVHAMLKYTPHDALSHAAVMIQFSPSEAPLGTETHIVNHTENLDQVSLLEKELYETQRRLKNVVKELETTNEALQTSNEELLSSNEELQSSNEELQSVNEELHTVNDEFQNKIEELRSLNNDIDNLISSTNIGTLFLDQDFCIRKVTPAAARLFPISEQDLGRPFATFSNYLVNIQQKDLLKNIRRVFKNLDTFEQEVVNQDGHCFLMKIQPFKTSTHSIEGVVLTFVSLNQLKEAEKERQKAQLLAQAAFEYAAVGKALILPNGSIIRVNRALCEMMGYSKVELLEKTLNELLHLEDEGKHQALLEGDLKQYSLEKRYIRKDGRVIWGLLNIAAIHENNILETIVVQIQDITKMKNHQKEYLKLNSQLKEANILLEASFQNASIGMDLVDPKTGKFVVVNKAFCKIFGYSEKELLKMRFQDITHPEDIDIGVDKVRATLQGQFDSFMIQKRYFHKSGKMLWGEVYGSAIRDADGNIEYILGQIKDITASKLMEKTLIDERRRLKKAEQLAHVGSWEMDIATESCIWSEEFYRICGLTPGASPLTKKDMFNLLHPQDRPRAIKKVNKAIKECGTYSFEKRVIRSDKQVRYVLSQGEVIPDEQGQPKTLLAAFLDITPLRNQEKLLQDTNQLLVRQNQQLESFTHITSHNLRAPIANIIALADILEEDLADTEHEEVISMLTKTSQTALQTLDNINQALMITKDIHKDLVVLNFEDILNKTMGVVEGLIQKKSATIESDFQVGQIKYPRLYLESIFLNLLSNALKYASPKRKPHIVFRSQKEQDNIILEVQDNGLGIDLKKHNDKVFGLYKTFHRHHDSRGVGLFMTRHQIEAMGGKIAVESEVDQGTCFKINFGSTIKV